jgi:hypothetical protein
MTIGALVALCELLGDLQRWLEEDRPGSLDIGLIAAVAEVATREAIKLQIGGAR